MILCNGQPKSGTNLLQKICGAMGLQDAEKSMVSFTPLHAEKGWMFANEIVDEETKERIDPAIAMGVDNFQFCHAHVTAASVDYLKGHKILMAKRDPRDMAVSFVRWQHRRRGVEASQDVLIDLLLNGYPPIRPTREDKVWTHNYVNFCSWFGPWYSEPAALCLEFEALWQPETIEKIAQYLEWPVDDPEKVAAQIYGNGKLVDGKPVYKTLSSWSGEHSDWREWWTPPVESAWRTIDGPRLVEIMGYTQ